MCSTPISFHLRFYHSGNTLSSPNFSPKLNYRTSLANLVTHQALCSVVNCFCSSAVFFVFPNVRKDIMCENNDLHIRGGLVGQYDAHYLIACTPHPLDILK